jgi:hypothetical protein
MKQTVNKSDFIDQFRVMDRLENFSYEARGLLFDYLEEYEQDSDEELEMDVIAVCCDYSEDSPADIADNYGIDVSECEDDDEVKDAVLDYLYKNTQVVGETTDGIVYANF